MNLLKNSKLIFSLSILLAFIVPQWAELLKPALVPLLIVMMTVSLKDMAFYHITKKNITHVVQLLLLNFVLLSALYMIVALVFIKNPDYRAGLFVLGVMPPAVGIVALAFILHASIRESLLAEFLGYLVSLVITPLMILIFLDHTLSPGHILKILLLVIVLPFILSRALHYGEKFIPILRTDYNKEIINLIYGISFYIIIGMNRDVFFTDFSSIFWIFIALITLKFGLGMIIFFTTYLFKMEREEIVTFTLFGTFKNGGAATAIVLLLFGVTATVPLAVNAILVPIYIIFLEWVFGDTQHMIHPDH